MKVSCVIAFAIAVLLALCGFCDSLKTSFADISALESFYKSTNGENWDLVNMGATVLAYPEFYAQFGVYASNLTGVAWNFSLDSSSMYINDPCEDPSSSGGQWIGLVCKCASSSCNITKISLTSGKLSGQIAPELGSLASLTILDLDSNALTGSIPASIGNLTQLTLLGLFANRLSGVIPMMIGNLLNLKYLVLSINSLSGSIPASLGNLSKLNNLYLGANRLSGPLPTSLSALTNLQLIYLNDNRLSQSIPSFLGTFKNLEYVFLNRNLFRGKIPQAIGGLNNLLEMHLNNNFLTGSIPSSIGNMSKLGVLNLEYNQLSGVVPWQMRNLRNLVTLQLSYNKLVSDPASPGFAFIDPNAQTKLSTLALGYNSFSGDVDSRIFALPALVTIALGSNCFSGSLPSNVCNATELETLVLSDLSGGTCHQTYLWKGTAFEDTFTAFTVDNLMEGSVPECIFNGMSKLKTIVLSGNRFLGQLPADLSPRITFLDVSQNYLTGDLPAAVSRPNFEFFDGSHNRFNGTLSNFGGAYSFTTPNRTLRLGVNRLSGDIPHTLKNLDDVNILTGNVFGCSTGTQNNLPVNDPNDVEYMCGSNAYDESLSIFAGFIFIFIIMLLCTYCWSLRYTAEIREWTKPFYQTEQAQASLVTGELELCPSLLRYGREMGHLRGFVLKMGLCIFLVFIIVYTSFAHHEYRTVNHVYGWLTTVALMVGTAPTVTLLTLWLLFMVVKRYMLLSHSSSSNNNDTESKTSTDTAESKDVVLGSILDDRNDAHSDAVDENKENDEDKDKTDITDRVLIPLLRLFIILVVKMGVSVCANAGFLYVLFHYDEMVQTFATAALGAFNLLFAFFFEWLFTAPILYFGVSRMVHNKFLLDVAGSEIYFLFVASSLSTFWIVLLTASVVEESCLYHMFISDPKVKTHYYVRQCSGWGYNGTCYAYTEEANFITIDSPYLYEYTCTSTLLRKYIPVFIAQYLIMIVVSVFQFYYLAWYTKNQREAEEDTSYYGQLLLLPKMVFMESRLLEGNSQRESIHMNDLAASKVMGKHQKYRMTTTRNTTQKYESLLTASSFVFMDHMNALLVLFTFGVFAPLLALVITLAVFVKLYINELVLGRCISIEAGIVALHKKRLASSSEEYVVKLAEGTRLRLYPDFASEKLRTVAHGESIIVDTSNAEKPSDSASGLAYVKVVGEPGWVPLNAIDFKCKNVEERMSLGQSCTITSKQQSVFSKRRLGLLATYKLANSDGTFVRKGPSFKASRLSTLYSGSTVELDLSEQVGAENATFVKLHGAHGWVALEALERVSVNRTDSRPARVTHYPLNLHLWLGGQTIDSVETMIRNADSPWGAASVLRTLEQECSQFPNSAVSLGERTFRTAFALSAAFVLNDTYNGITGGSPSYWAPIVITSAVPAFDIVPYVWSNLPYVWSKMWSKIHDLWYVVQNLGDSSAAEVAEVDTEIGTGEGEVKLEMGVCVGYESKQVEETENPILQNRHGR